MTQEYRLARNWWILYVVTAVLTAGTLFIVWAITWPAFKAAQADQPLPDGWTWARIITVDVVVMFLHATAFGVVLVQLLTTFTNEGVRRPSIFGAIFIRWSEVAEIMGYSPGMIVLELCSAKRRIRINMLYFKDKNELISLVREHVPSLVRLD